jgi:hypothetical protein
MIKPVLQALLAVCLTTTVAKAADSPFIGMWKLDPSRSRLPDEFTVLSKGGGAYEFNFNGTVETIAVDGRDQSGQAGTLLSVSAQAPDTWVVERKQGGRRLLRATWKLSSDGRTLVDYFRGFEADGSTVSTDYVYQRIGQGSGFAAVWRSVKETMNSPYLLQVTAFQGDGLSFDDAFLHVTKNMKFDGADYPREGANAPSGAFASVRRVDERRLVITDKRNGKVTETEEVGLSTNLKTLTITQHIAGQDRPNVLVFKRTRVA